jgi:hypothetical protein
MFKTFVSLALVVTLVCSLGGASAYAQTSLEPVVKSKGVNALPDSSSAGKKEAQPSRGLKADIQQLVADAKADRRLSVSDPQTQPKQSNSLSKTTKIAIVAGIAAAVIIIIIFVHARNHFFDDFRLGN